MKCTYQDCTGEYEGRYVMHTVRHKGEIVVIEKVPALVCTICGDVLLKPETVREIERLLASRGEPTGTARVYQFA